MVSSLLPRGLLGSLEALVGGAGFASAFSWICFLSIFMAGCFTALNPCLTSWFVCACLILAADSKVKCYGSSSLFNCSLLFGTIWTLGDVRFFGEGPPFLVLGSAVPFGFFAEFLMCLLFFE